MCSHCTDEGVEAVAAKAQDGQGWGDSDAFCPASVLIVTRPAPSRSNDRKRHPSRKALTPAAPPLSLSSPLWKEGVPGAENCLEQQGWGSAGLTRGGDGGGRRGADGDEVLESGVCVLRGCQAAGRKRLGERTVAGRRGAARPPGAHDAGGDGLESIGRLNCQGWLVMGTALTLEG